MSLLAERFDEWLAAINYSPKTRVNYLPSSVESLAKRPLPGDG